MEDEEQKKVFDKIKLIVNQAKMTWSFSKDLEIALFYYLSQAYWLGKKDGENKCDCTEEK